MTSRARSPLKIRLKLQEMSEASIENSPTNAAAFRPLVGISAIFRTTAYTGGAVATA